MTHTSASIEDVIAVVATEAAQREERARSGDRLAIEELIDGGFSLVDQGMDFAAEPIVKALLSLAQAAFLDERDLGWYANLRGRLAYGRGDIDGAQTLFDRALATAEKASDQALFSSVLLNLGIVAWEKGRLDDAVRQFEKSIANRKGLGFRARAQAQINLAGVHLEAGNIAAARQLSRRILRSRTVQNDPRLYASALGVAGQIAVASGDLATADSLFRHSGRVARRAKAYPHLLTALQNVGAVSLDMSQPGVALRWLRRAERLARILRSFDALESLQRTVATALHRLGRQSDARAHLAKARDEARARDSEIATARITADLGALAIATRKPRDAVEYLTEATSIFLQHRQWTAATRAVTSLARSLIELGDLRRATTEINRVAEGELTSVERGQLFEGFGDVLLSLGQMREAVSTYEHAAQIFALERQTDELWRIAMKTLEANGAAVAANALTQVLESESQHPSSLTVARLLNDRALAFLQLDRTDDAHQDLEQALAAARGEGDRVMRAVTLSNLSELERRRGRTEPALAFAAESVLLADATGDQSQKARALTMRALAAAEQGKWDAAIADHRVALAIARRLGDPSLQAVAIGGMAQVNFALARYRRAAVLYGQAATLESEVGDVPHEMESRAALMETYAITRDRTAHDRELQRLINLVQRSGGPIEIAIVGMSRAGGVWLRAGRVGTAAYVFATSLLLALAQVEDWETPEGMRYVAQAMMSPFVYAAAIDVALTDELDREMRRRLRRRLGPASDIVFDRLSEARLTAGDVLADH